MGSTVGAASVVDEGATQIARWEEGISGLPHPRVLFGPGEVAGMRARWEHPDLAVLVDPIRKAAHGLPIDEVGPSDEPVGSLIPACQALVAILNDDPGLASAAVEGMQAFLSSYDPRSGPSIEVNWGRIGVGNAILHAAMVYDWAYDALGASDRAGFIAQIERLAAAQEIGYPTLGGSAVGGHAGERELLCNLLAAGIAIYDEYPDMLRTVAVRILRDYAPVRRFVYRSGRHPEGTSYQGVRFFPELLACKLLGQIGVPAAFGSDQRRIPYHWIYQRLPNGQLLLDGDVGYPFKLSSGDYWASALTLPTLLAASMFSDPYLQSAGLRMLKEANTFRAAGHDRLLAFFAVDPMVPTAPLSDLPLVHFTDDPLAGAIARTGWNLDVDSPDSVVELKVGGVHLSNHQHLDAGAFQVFSPGPLAVETGLYTYRSYASDHVVNFAKRTIAHNCLLIHDPDERPIWKDAGRPVANDGGQRWPHDAVEPLLIRDLYKPTDPARVASLLAADTDDPASPSYVHLKGDLTGAYGTKAQSYQRSFVLLYGSGAEPLVLLVRDRVSVRNPSFRTTWVMHTVDQPVWRGGVAVVEPSGRSHRGLVVQPIVPTPDACEARIIDEGRGDFPIGPLRFPTGIAPEQIPDCFGKWRLELTATSPGRETEYLVAVTVTENGSPPPIQRVSAVGTELVRYGGRLVGFSTNGQPMDGTVVVRLEDRLVTDCLLTDLMPGHWMLTSESGSSAEIVVQPGVGTARITESPNNFSLVPLKCGGRTDGRTA